MPPLPLIKSAYEQNRVKRLRYSQGRIRVTVIIVVTVVYAKLTLTTAGACLT